MTRTNCECCQITMDYSGDYLCESCRRGFEDDCRANPENKDFWEGSYKGAPSQEYIDYWRVIDSARAVLRLAGVEEK